MRTNNKILFVLISSIIKSYYASAAVVVKNEEKAKRRNIRVMKRTNKYKENKSYSRSRSLLSIFELLAPKNTVAGTPEFIRARSSSGHTNNNHSAYDRCIQGIQLTLNTGDFFQINYQNFVEFIRIYTNDKFETSVSDYSRNAADSLPLPLISLFNTCACECGEKLFEVPNCW